MITHTFTRRPIIYSFIAILLSLHLAKLHAWVDKQDTKVTGSLVDAIAGNPAVKAFGAEKREDKRHARVLDEMYRRLWLTWRRGNVITWIQFMLLIIIEMILLLLALWLWYNGEFTAGGFIVVTFYIGNLWGRMFDIGQHVRNYLRASAHAQEMVGLYHMPVGVPDHAEAIGLHIKKGAIHFGDVSFRYNSTTPAIFSHLSVDIEAGEKIALVGHSGGGKSTFVKLLLRLHDVQEGIITIDGQDIAEVTQKSLRRSVALVPQDPVLFHRTVLENISYTKPNASFEEILSAAKKAHAHEFIRNLPEQYETLVGERGVKLSGGERQRVAIARAFLANAPILIMDEATSSLDSQSEQFIQEALTELMKNRTTIVVAHRLSTIKHVDRILVIESGKIVEEGSHAALIRKRGGIYKGFYEVQAGGFIGE